MSLSNTKYKVNTIFLLKKTQELKLSQIGISRIAKIPQSCVNDIFAGKRPNPTMDTICKIAEALRSNVDELMIKK